MAKTPITDTEASYYDEGGLSFDPLDAEEREGPVVTIVHHNGEATVYQFTRIEEINPESQTIRVWYDDDMHEDFHVATITSIEQLSK